MWWVAFGCGGPGSVLDAPPALVRPVPGAARAVALARPGIAATFTLPASNRPGGAPAPAEFPLPGPFVDDLQRPMTDIYRVPLPIPPHLLPSTQAGTHAIGNHAPTGFVLRGPDGVVPFERRGRRAGTWGFDEQFLYLGVRSGSAPPVAEQYTVTFPKAAATENALNYEASGLSADAFVRRTVTIGGSSYTGLFLPPPAEARFTLTVPAQARLSFTPHLLPPSVPSPVVSDGARVEVAVESAGQERVVSTVEVSASDAGEVEVDLSAFAGQPVTLRFRTSPNADPALDYVLLASPTVYSPAEDPRRIVILFVDTLRADHLGFTGYARDTSPTLDRLAQHATVFTEARAVSPWTLPSTRAMWSGREPEEWASAVSLAERFGAAGFHTEALVTNAFLSQPFDVHRGWDVYHYDFQLPAAQVVARAVEVLGRHADQDQLLLVHFMEPHLPYREPDSVRRTWEKEVPAVLGEDVFRSELMTIRPEVAGFDAVRDYVIARYDQEILGLDQALPPLFEAAGPNATFVLVSDHGEELWDHGGFEHGHAFYDELLRVPFVVRSPALPPGTVETPVSLLDVLPTLCEIGGISCPDVDGTSLVPVSWNDAGARERLRDRTLVFGRPLYGPDGWGVLHDGKKWWDRAGVQILYDLSADRAEQTNLAPTDPSLAQYPGELAAALGREVRVAWRIDINAPDGWRAPVGMYVSHPRGLADAWIGFDPRGRGLDTPLLLREGRVSLEVPAEHPCPRTVWVVPNGDPYDVHGLVLSLTGQGVALLGAAAGQRTASSDPEAILTAVGSQFRVNVEIGFVPTPSGGEVPGFSLEMESELRALGYLDDAD